MIPSEFMHDVEYPNMLFGMAAPNPCLQSSSKLPDLSVLRKLLKYFDLLSYDILSRATFK